MARIETTPAVRLALYFLRVYLVILLLLILIKFLRLFPSHAGPPKHHPATAAISAVYRGAAFAPRAILRLSGASGSSS